MTLLISKKGIEIIPKNLSKKASNNGCKMYIDNSGVGHKLIVCDFNLYKLFQLNNFIINDLFVDEYNDLGFYKIYSNMNMKDYFYYNDYKANYFKLLKDNHLNLNNKAYYFNGHRRFTNIDYTFYKYFDFTDLMNYIDEPYLCDTSLKTYIDNTLKLIHKNATPLSLEYVFQLNNPDKIINL